MNKFALLTAASLMFASTAAGWCSGTVDRPHDWTVNIETQQLQRQFEYQNSTIKPVVKANINYYHQTDSAHATPYEYMWFHDGKPLGVERLHKFGVDQGDGVAVSITHKTTNPNLGEKKAAADALVHVVLDSYLNKNAVTIVYLPQNSFNDISNDLQTRHHFITQADAGADHPVESGINIFLESDPPGTSQTLYYF